MKRSMRAYAVRILPVVVTLLIVRPALMAAQEDAQADPMTELLAELGQIQARIGFLRARADTAAGEDRELFEDQLARRWKDHHRVLARMVSETEAAREAGTERADVDDVLGSAVLRDFEYVRSRTEEVRREIDAIRLARPDMPPEDLTGLELQLTDLNLALDRLIVAAVDDVEWADWLDVTLPYETALLDRTLDYRAAVIAARIEMAKDQRNRLAERLTRTGVDSVVVQAEIAALDEKLRGTTASLENMVNLMQRRDLPTGPYRQLILETGQLRATGLDVEAVGGLLQNRVDQAREWLAENSGTLAVRTVAIVLVLLAFGVLARLARRAVRTLLGSARVDLSELLKRLLIGMTSKLIWLVGVLVALSMIGVDVGPMLAGLGIAGFVIGFALQDTLSNFASGLMIMFYRPFDVGDFITAGGISGAVQSLTLVSTIITTPDNQLVIVPNNKVWGDVINNVTAQDTRRVDLVFGIAYEDDIDKARSIMQEVVRAHDLVLDDPEPVIRVHNLGDSSVDFVCRPWCRTEDYWTVRWDITETVKQRFDGGGITIPFPQRDVHIIHQGEAGAGTPA